MGVALLVVCLMGVALLVVFDGCGPTGCVFDGCGTTGCVFAGIEYDSIFQLCELLCTELRFLDHNKRYVTTVPPAGPVHVIGLDRGPSGRSSS